MLRPVVGDMVRGLTGLDYDVPIHSLANGFATFLLGPFELRKCPLSRLQLVSHEAGKSIWVRGETPTQLAITPPQFLDFTVSWQLSSAKGNMLVRTRDALLAYHVALPRIAKELKLDTPFVYSYFSAHPDRVVVTSNV